MNKPKEELTAIAKDLERRITNSKHPRRGRPIKQGEKLVQTGLYLKREQLEGLKDQAKRRGISASELLRELVDKYLGGAS